MIRLCRIELVFVELLNQHVSLALSFVLDDIDIMTKGSHRSMYQANRNSHRLIYQTKILLARDSLDDNMISHRMHVA